MIQPGMQKFLRRCLGCEEDETVFAPTREDVSTVCTNCSRNTTEGVVIDGPLWQPSKGQPFRLQDIKPLRDRILVQPLAVSSRTKSGLHMPEMSHQREKPMHGIVVRVGPGAHNRQTDTLIRLQVRVGDCVFYGKYSGQEFTIEEQIVLNMGENEVYSVLPRGAFEVVEHEDQKLNHLFGDYCDLCATPEELAAKASWEAERKAAQEARIAAAIAGEPVQDLAGVTAPAGELAIALQEVVDEANKPTGPSFLEQEREKARLARLAAEDAALS